MNTLRFVHARIVVGLSRHCHWKAGFESGWLWAAQPTTAGAEEDHPSGKAVFSQAVVRSDPQPPSRDFWLFHLSGHHRARDVMVGLHWKLQTSFAHYGRPGLRMLGYHPEEDRAWTEQKILPAFMFDETALVASQEELLQQLPERLRELGESRTFADMFAHFTNESPVTSEIMRNVLSDLAREGVIDVYD